MVPFSLKDQTFVNPTSTFHKNTWHKGKRYPANKGGVTAPITDKYCSTDDCRYSPNHVVQPLQTFLPVQFIHG